ncbi:MAG: hypothetical protein K6T85_15420, partial [Gorillibacterium sp.]|nr:hypothetical protein [Gorillibacterium sp.]
MRERQHLFAIVKKTISAIVVLTLLLSTGILNTARAAAPVVKTYVYYTSGGDLYRVGNDGAHPQLLVSDYEGAYPFAGGKFLYFYKDAESNTIMRVPA